MLTVKEKEVYGKIYDITKENMEKSGENMIPLREAFLYSVKKYKNIDILELSQLSKKDLVQVIYIVALQRFIDIPSLNNYNIRSEIEKEEDFKRNLILTILTSKEFNNKKLKYKNNIYSRDIKKEIIEINQKNQLDRLEEELRKVSDVINKLKLEIDLVNKESETIKIENIKLKSKLEELQEEVLENREEIEKRKMKLWFR